MFRIIQEINPPYVFAENVQEKPIKKAAENLYEIGYSCRYMCLCPAPMGAPITRKRYWLAAYADPNSELRRPEHVETPLPSTFEAMEWWQDDSRRLGIRDGMANRLDRMQALGNGQVAICAAMAWVILSNGFTNKGDV